MSSPDERPIDDGATDLDDVVERGDERAGDRCGDRAADRAGDRAGGPNRGATVIRFPSTSRRSTPAEPDPRLRDVLGDVLRDERRRQQRTLADVADAAAVSLPYLSEVERGRKEVSSDLLGAVCDALEIPLVDVLERCVDRLRARAQGGSGIQLRAA